MRPTYHRISLSDPTDAVLSELLALITTVFPDMNSAATLEDVRWRLSYMPCCWVFCARIEGQMVGFKVGYATKARHYYSWLGGVHTRWLRQGIARELMAQQHAWLRSEGFAVVETAAQAKNEAMCELNLASGFELVGSREKRRGLQLIYEKQLDGEVNT